VLLDIGMPHLNGYDVARLIRKEFGDGQRICAITAYGKPHDREQSRQAGIDAHLYIKAASWLSGLFASTPEQHQHGMNGTD
jgi:CheY-like chemotaxis protein